MPEIVTLAVLRSAAQLEALTAQWRLLWESDPWATPFQHPAWLVPWWHCFGQQDLRAVTLCSEGRLLALIPLYVYPEPVSGERQLLLLGAGTSDYLDGIFSPECTSEDIDRALRFVGEEGGWDVAHFTQLRAESPLLHAARRLRGTRYEPYAGDHCSQCPAVAIADLPRKVRADVVYYRNFAIGRGAIELCMANKEDWKEAFELLVRFHTQRWEEAGERGVLADPAVLAWHREALPQLHAEGLLRLATLRVAGESIAVLYSLIDPPAHARRSQYFYLMGFSLQHAELRPGTLLTALAVEHAAAEGVAIIDMLRGKEAYKQFWHVTPVPTYGFAVRRDGREHDGSR